MQVVVDGLLTQYERIGSGKPVLVLHGWGDSSKGWQVFAKKISASGYEVIVCDLPGFGATQAPATSWNLTQYANFVRSFVDKIGVHPYSIIGHSNGGAIAIRGLGTGELQTERLILLASSGVRGEGSKSWLRFVAKVGKICSAPLPKLWQKKMRKTLYNKAGSDMLVAEHMQDTFKRIVTDDVRADAAKIQVPTLLIYGSEDAATPVSYGKLLHDAINGSKIIEVPAAGHFIHTDAETVVLGAVTEFLQ